MTTLPPPRLQRLQEDIRRHRTKLGCLMCPHKRRCPPSWPEGSLVDVREIMGYTPWLFGAADARHVASWAQLRLPGGFGARWGLLTAERRHRCFNFTTACVTSWNGPVWPFESAKLGGAMIATLNGPHAGAASPYLQKADFAAFLRTYARMHTRGRAVGVAAGTPFVGESFHGDDGYWITRALLHQRRAGDRDRGDHYFHSSYCDLVLAGICGVLVRGLAAPATLVINPLVTAAELRWFACTGLLVRGSELAVRFDADGTYYGEGGGLMVWLNGSLVAHAHQLQRIVLPNALS